MASFQAGCSGAGPSSRDDEHDFVEEFVDDGSDEDDLEFSEQEWESIQRRRRADREAQRREGAVVSDDSDTESEGEMPDDDNPGRDVPDGYDHGWLQDFVESSGPTAVPENASEGEVFDLFFTEEVFNLLVVETNRYAAQMIAARGQQAGPGSYLKKWKDVSLQEMKAFIAVLLLMGVCKRGNYHLYWTTDPILEMQGFRKIMSRDRFKIILSFFHLADNTTAIPVGEPDHDRAHKVRPLTQLLVPLWQRHFVPSKEISVDESMVPFKGRTQLMQYMPKKPSKWGIKAWGLADAKSGYMWNWQLYLGKQRVEQLVRERGLAHQVVLSLAEPLYGKGHVVYMDNFFSSGALFEELASHHMGACGTFRTNRRGVPPAIKAAKPDVGVEPVVQRDGHSLYMVWRDKRLVTVMSTVHSAQTFMKEVRSRHHEDHVRRVLKPCAVQAYTQHMGGVDRADKALSYFMVLHRSRKWWKKVFFYLLEVCFVNSLVIWRSSHAKIEAQAFRHRIVQHLLRGFQAQVVYRHAAAPEADLAVRLNLQLGHFPMENPKRLNGGKPSRPDCVVCSDRSQGGRRHQTTTVCSVCRVPLCIYFCFKRYHTELEYKWTGPKPAQ